LSVVDASAEAQQMFGDIGDEREIWRPLIILTFVIIGIEFLLSTLGGRATGDNGLNHPQRFGDFVRAKVLGRMTGSGFQELTTSKLDN